jgi:hypothetical protein
VREIGLGLTQSVALFFSALALGYIHDGTHEFACVAGRFNERVAYSVHISGRPFRKNNSEMSLDIGSCADCFLKIVDGPVSIFGMNALTELFE